MTIRDYRFYFVDRTGRIVGVVNEQCEGDEPAVIHAGQLLSGSTARTIDIWTGERRIAVLGAEYLKAPLSAPGSQS
jgi:hypothetical protein